MIGSASAGADRRYSTVGTHLPQNLNRTYDESCSHKYACCVHLITDGRYAVSGGLQSLHEPRVKEASC